MPYGNERYGFYVYGLEELILTGQGISTGEFEEDYGDKYGISTGRFDADYSLLVTGEGISSGVVNKDISYPLTGSGYSTGTIDYLYIAALVDYICYVLNTDTKRTYNFDTYGFRGIGRFNGKLIGARGNVIYDLETVATLDNATAIASYLEFKTDFGLAGYAGLRSLYVEDDSVTITITDDKGNVVANNITPLEFRGLPKNLVSTAFTIRITNILGEQITLRRVHGKINVIPIRGD